MIGFLTTSLDLQQRASTDDGQGGYKDAWITIRIIKGSIQTATGSDIRRAGRDDAALTHVIYCLVDDTIKATDRFLDQVTGKAYEILDIRKPGGKQHHLEIDCREFQIGTD